MERVIFDAIILKGQLVGFGNHHQQNQPLSGCLSGVCDFGKDRTDRRITFLPMGVGGAAMRSSPSSVSEPSGDGSWLN